MRIDYEISRPANEWTLTRNGEAGVGYATAEAAFEVAFANASIEMRSDHEIVIRVTPARDDEMRPDEGSPLGYDRSAARDIEA